MLTVDDAARITTAEALAHPWLAEAAAAADAGGAYSSSSSGVPSPKGGKDVADGTLLRGQGRQQEEQRGERAQRLRTRVEVEEEDDDAAWVHTPGGEGSGPLRSLLDAVWCRGSSFIASFSPRGPAAAKGATHSGSDTSSFSSISSSASSGELLRPHGASPSAPGRRGGGNNSGSGRSG
jgi:hypothetical protein